VKSGMLLCKAVFRAQFSIITTSLVTHGSVAEETREFQGYHAALAFVHRSPRPMRLSSSVPLISSSWLVPISHMSEHLSNSRRGNWSSCMLAFPRRGPPRTRLRLGLGAVVELELGVGVKSVIESAEVRILALPIDYTSLRSRCDIGAAT
jgi:hypothetical protein